MAHPRVLGRHRHQASRRRRGLAQLGGLRGAAGEPRRVPARPLRPDGPLPPAWHPLRPLRRGLRPRAHRLRLHHPRGSRRLPRLHARGRAAGLLLRWLALRRARRRPCTFQPAAGDVLAGDARPLRRVQGDLRPRERVQPRRACRPRRGHRRAAHGPRPAQPRHHPGTPLHLRQGRLPLRDQPLRRCVRLPIRGRRDVPVLPDHGRRGPLDPRACAPARRDVPRRGPARRRGLQGGRGGA